MRHSQAYYIRHGYGVFAIRNKREAKALYDFCAAQIVEMMDYSPECREPRLEIFKHTMNIYANNFLSDPSTLPDKFIKCNCGHCEGRFVSYDLYSYANAHAGFYWS